MFIQRGNQLTVYDCCKKPVIYTNLCDSMRSAVSMARDVSTSIWESTLGGVDPSSSANQFDYCMSVVQSASNTRISKMDCKNREPTTVKIGRSGRVACQNWRSREILGRTRKRCRRRYTMVEFRNAKRSFRQKGSFGERSKNPTNVKEKNSFESKKGMNVDFFADQNL